MKLNIKKIKLFFKQKFKKIKIKEGGKRNNLHVWEVYSEGCEPYPSLSNIQTRAKIIVQNYRMNMPEVFLILFKNFEFMI